MEFKLDANTLFLATYFLVPGVVIITIRNYFSVSKVVLLSEVAWKYIPISLIYAAVTLPIAAYHSLIDGEFSALVWYLIVIIIPSIVGLVYGLMGKSESLYIFLRERMHLPITHRIGTAWDWRFSNFTGSYVRVKLDDDTEFAGFAGAASFISSDSDHRDIFIEKTYILENGLWVEPPRPTSALVGANRIKSIEFIEDVENGEQA